MTSKVTGKKKEVIDFIERKIRDGQLVSGDKLDSESAISKILGITRTTVREATRYLVEAGRIYPVKGSGLYVGTGDDVHSGKFHSLSPFDHQARKAGKKAIRKVISAAIIPVPSPQIAHALKIKPTENVYYVQRLMCFGSMPVALECIHIAVTVANGFQFNQIEKSKYGYIEELTGKKVFTREQDIAAFNIRDKEIADLLKVDIDQAMIELREVVCFEDGSPFEYTIATINSDLFNIHQVIRRD